MCVGAGVHGTDVVESAESDDHERFSGSDERSNVQRQHSGVGHEHGRARAGSHHDAVEWREAGAVDASSDSGSCDSRWL